MLLKPAETRILEFVLYLLEDLTSSEEQQIGLCGVSSYKQKYTHTLN
jgi:hypothetical protein